MGKLDRRDFLKRSAGAAGGAVAGLTALMGFAAKAAAHELGPPEAEQGDGGYGRLRNAGPELQLPEGFEYRVLSVEDTVMSDGYIVPGKHDGMCAFPMPNGNIRLIRNHEVDFNPSLDVVAGDPTTAYDPAAGGGTTSLEVDPVTREVVRDFISLNGTWRNCAGGPTPWDTWLSAEEAFFGEESGFGKPHGYIFEVPATREAAEYTEPLVEMGRFVHEAVAVDPETGIVYETEDHFRAGFYRFLPNQPYREGNPGNLRAGGGLQMLAIRNRGRYDTSKRQRVGRTLPTEWIDILFPNPLGGPEVFNSVFTQGYEVGGARFSRLEGCWYDSGRIYFVATDGGDQDLGQVWQFEPTGPDDGELTLIYECRNRGTLKRPDNLCISPNGAILLCEDANMRRQYVRGLTKEGRVFDIVGCRIVEGELAGVTFSPDGKTMFCNTLGHPRRKPPPAMTFAIWGPWERGAV